MFQYIPRLLFIALGIVAHVQLVINTGDFTAGLHAAMPAELSGCESLPQQVVGRYCNSVAGVWNAIRDTFASLWDRLDHKLVIVGTIIFVSSIAEAGFGFGGGLLAIPLLSLVIGLQAGVSLFLVFQTLKGTLLIPGFRHIAWTKIRLVILLLPVGAWLGFLSLGRFEQGIIRIGLSAYLIAYVITQYVRRPYVKAPHPSSALRQIATGIVTGYVQGLIGSGGPLLVTYLKACNVEPNMFRFSVIFMLIFTNIFRIGLAIKYKMIDYNTCAMVLACLPAYVFALLIGYKLPKLLTEMQFTRIINIIITLAAVSLLANGWG